MKSKSNQPILPLVVGIAAVCIGLSTKARADAKPGSNQEQEGSRMETYPAPADVALNSDCVVTAKDQHIDIYKDAVRREEECFVSMAYSISPEP